jgi:hypothetical protein
MKLLFTIFVLTGWIEILFISQLPVWFQIIFILIIVGYGFGVAIHYYPGE